MVVRDLSQVSPSDPLSEHFGNASPAEVPFDPEIDRAMRILQFACAFDWDALRSAADLLLERAAGLHPHYLALTKATAPQPRELPESSAES